MTKVLMGEVPTQKLRVTNLCGNIRSFLQSGMHTAELTYTTLALSGVLTMQAQE